MKHLATSALLVAAACAAAPASAQLAFGQMDTGLYLGGNVGWSRASVDQPTVPAGFAVTSFDKDENDAGFKAYGGYRFTRNLALEGGYARLGKFGFNGTTAPAATFANSFKVDGWFVDAVAMIPLQQGFTVLGRVGAYFNELKTSPSATGPLTAGPGIKDRDTSLKLGLGAQYDLTPMLAVRAEWEHFRKIGDAATTGQSNINLLSLGMLVKFQ